MSNYSKNDSNEVLTHNMIAKEGAAMLVAESKFIQSVNREREKEFAKDSQGYKKGESVRIKIPPVPIVTEGHVYKEADANENAKERHVMLTVDTQKHVSLQFGMAERALHISQFKDRFLRPAIGSLATDIDADLLKRAIVTVNNATFIQANEIHPLGAWGRARTMLQRCLAPSSKRICLLSSEISNRIVDNSGRLFNPTKEIAKQYKEGYLGRARGFEFLESEHIFRQQTGSHSKNAVKVVGAGQTGNTLTIGGLSNGETIKAGEVFSIAGVEQIHPITRQSFQVPLQFVVLEDVEAGGSTATVKIFPEITPATIGNQLKGNATVSASPANDAAITFLMDSDSLIEQALCYDRDTFATAFVPLKVVEGCEGHTVNASSMALRVQTGGDWKNDFEGTRIDVLYGFTTVRNNHGARILAG